MRISHCDVTDAAAATVLGWNAQTCIWGLFQLKDNERVGIRKGFQECRGKVESFLRPDNWPVPAKIDPIDPDKALKVIN